MSRAAIDGLSAAAVRPASARVDGRTLIEFAKPGITRMVTIAAGFGFALAALYHGLAAQSLLIPLLGCVLGTALASAGANGLNQILERDRDARMKRTLGRPLPTGRMTMGHAVGFSIACSVIGPVLLAATASPEASIAALATILLYAFVYTPMKPASSLAVIVGAVPGAIPVLIGWLAASPTPLADLRTPAAWSIFAVLFVWQMPHFLAIASMHRADYQRGGFRAIPGNLDDRRLSWVVLAWSAALIAVAYTPPLVMPDHLGLLSAVAATLLGLGLLRSAWRYTRDPGPARARGVFIFTIIYLPLMLLALTVDATAHGFLR
ncbi:MAG: heme o synthase [Planctomycetota bacterium]